MEFIDGSFSLTVPNGTITFSEAGENFTFTGLLNSIQDYTDSINAAGSTATAASLSSAVAQTEVRRANSL